MKELNLSRLVRCFKKYQVTMEVFFSAKKNSSNFILKVDQLEKKGKKYFALARDELKLNQNSTLAKMSKKDLKLFFTEKEPNFREDGFNLTDCG
jgi:hypothetical protein